MWCISIKKDVVLSVAFLFGIIWSFAQVHASDTVAVFSMPVSKKVVWIDAGHGAFA